MKHGLNTDFLRAMNEMDDMKFFVWLNDQQQGPFSERTIQKMLAEKQITKDTLICPEGGDLDWIPAKDLFLQDSLPESFIPPPSIDELLEQSDDGSRLDIRLNSGEELKIKAIKLYDEMALARVNSKRTEAIKLLKGVSTGIRPWGSIGWVLAASAVIGTVESVLSAGTSSTGANLLEEAVRAERNLYREGVFFPAGKIQYIETPMPDFWRAYAKTKNATSAFIHNGDEFISVMTDDGSDCSIRWAAIGRYCYSKSKF
jgi:hypothetical protein